MRYHKSRQKGIPLCCQRCMVRSLLLHIQLWGEGTLWGGANVGSFMTCAVKYILAKHVAFTLCLSFLIFRLDILIFTKLMISNIIWKKKINSRNDEYIYGICSIIEPFFCGLHLELGLELINQKMFQNLKMTHLTYLVILHLKVIVCENVNLPHTYGHCLKKHQFVI